MGRALLAAATLSALLVVLWWDFLPQAGRFLYDATTLHGTVDDKVNEIRLVRDGRMGQIAAEAVGRWEPAHPEGSTNPLPLALLAAAMAVVPAIPAFNTTMFAAWAASGLAVWGLARQLGAAPVGAFAGAALFLLNPWTVATMRQSSLDYALLAPLPLLVWGLAAGRWWLAALAMAALGLSNHYYLLAGGIFVVAALPATGWRGLLGPAVAALALAPLLLAEWATLRGAPVPGLAVQAGVHRSLLVALGAQGLLSPLLLGLAASARRDPWTRSLALAALALATTLVLVRGPTALQLDGLPLIWRARRIDALAAVPVLALSLLTATALGALSRRGWGRSAHALAAGAVLAALIQARSLPSDPAPDLRVPEGVADRAGSEILLVEPDEPTARVLAFYLREWTGATVHTAETRRQGRAPPACATLVAHEGELSPGFRTLAAQGGWVAALPESCP